MNRISELTDFVLRLEPDEIINLQSLAAHIHRKVEACSIPQFVMLRVLEQSQLIHNWPRHLAWLTVIDNNNTGSWFQCASEIFSEVEVSGVVFRVFVGCYSSSHTQDLVFQDLCAAFAAMHQSFPEVGFWAVT